MSGRFARGAALVFTLALAPAAAGGPAAAQAPTDSQIKAEVRKEFARLDKAISRLTVEVSHNVVMLSGTVPTLWLKEEAIRRALKVNGVMSLESDIVIPPAENDAALLKAVADRIRQYSLYTVYDNITGRVGNGRVRLEGAVTEPKKYDDLYERVAKVKGVQAIDNRLVVLPASREDDRLRVVIANAIYSDQAFADYSMVDPPVHVIVSNGHVTLVGYVRSDIERIKAESIARSAYGVLAFDNRIEVVSASRPK